jgi:hypothetical protein
MNLIGKYILVKTKTKDDIFGDCLYQIVGPVIEHGDKRLVKCEMLSGTGSSARQGFTVTEDLGVLEAAINIGITHRLVSPGDAALRIQAAKNNGGMKPGNIIEL